MTTVADYQGIQSAWCPGCGNFGILNAVKKALVKLDKQPSEVLLCSGIGQAGKFPHYVRANVFNGLHGRSVPAAFAAKMANPKLTVFAIGGDGDMYGEGGNHLLHAMRRNIDITVLVHNNQVYGLTKGQASPTQAEGVKTNLQPEGVITRPLNPLTLAISQKCSWVGRGFSGKPDHLAELIQKAVENRGFSLLDILQPCVTFNKINTFAWYRSRVYELDSSYNASDYHGAYDKAEEWGERIPIGVIYRNPAKSYHEYWPQLKERSLLDQAPDPQRAQTLIDSLL